jgi:hypothetical protein
VNQLRTTERGILHRTAGVGTSLAGSTPLGALLAGSTLIGALFAGTAFATPAAAAPSPDPDRPAETICTVQDPRLHEISGLVAVAGGYVAINDSNPDPGAMRVFYLDGRCRLTRSVGYPQPARDPEDLATAPDGSLWVADVGDNTNAKTHRDTVTLWRLATGSRTPTQYRLAYPSGHHDAEAMVIDGDGLPVIVTKELGGSAAMYKPSAPLSTSATTPLAQVGRFTPHHTGTANPFGFIGQNTVTGAAVSADRHRVALRTYSDAYEFDVADGDLVAAISAGSPRITALPDEPQGESIAYTPDGTGFLTVSDAAEPTPLLRWVPNRPARAAPPGSQPGSSPGQPVPASPTPDRRGAVRAAAPGEQRGDRLLAAAFIGFGGLAVGGVLVLRRRLDRRRPGSP